MGPSADTAQSPENKRETSTKRHEHKLNTYTESTHMCSHIHIHKLNTYMSMMMYQIYLSVSQSVCLSLCTSVCLSVGLSVRLLSVRLSCLSVYLYLYASVCLSVCLGCLSVRLYVYVSLLLSVRLSIYLSVRLVVCLSICPSNPWRCSRTPLSPAAVCDAVPLYFLFLQEDHFRDCVLLRSVGDRRWLAGHPAGGPGPDPWESGL